jgi:hypothetical protein
MKNKMKQCALLAASSSMLMAFSASAANSLYAVGDLMLTFQKAGSTNTVYASLGNAALNYRGAALGPDAAKNNINFMDLSSSLVSAFGTEWATDTGIYASVSGAYASSPTSNTVVNGDASRTLYVSAARNSIGDIGSANSTQAVLTGSTNLTNAAADIIAQNAILGSAYTETAQAVSVTSTSLIDDKQPLSQNPDSSWAQGTAFRGFGGGIAQVGSADTIGSFGQNSGTAEFALDLYRIAAVANKTNQINGTQIGYGDYEGTVSVNSAGLVSFTTVPEPSAFALTGLAAASLVLRRRRSA